MTRYDTLLEHHAIAQKDIEKRGSFSPSRLSLSEDLRSAQMCGMFPCKIHVRTVQKDFNIHFHLNEIGEAMENTRQRTDHKLSLKFLVESRHTYGS
ncbi:MAG TPA: hypothetical protein DCE42_20155 [Myxococcales bacterium]|nr:hypothetical protein [Deltaproteobacteria bacterium]HAA57090.1 hypothetical protein [Myxococcales bacterium]